MDSAEPLFLFDFFLCVCLERCAGFFAYGFLCEYEYIYVYVTNFFYLKPYLYFFFPIGCWRAVVKLKMW